MSALAGQRPIEHSMSRFSRDPSRRNGRTPALTSASTLGVVLTIVLIPLYGPWLNAPPYH
jgi:hypothetical protein